VSVVLKAQAQQAQAQQAQAAVARCREAASCTREHPVMLVAVTAAVLRLDAAWRPPCAARTVE